MQSILGHTRKADITFHRNGRIDISAIVTKSLGLNAGDVLDICMSDYGEYYLVIAHKAINTNGNHRAKVFVTKVESIIEICAPIALSFVKLC